MNPAELTFGALLAAVLLGLAGYFIWRQKKTIQKSRQENLSPEDRLYVQRQVQRRLLCSILMIVLAGMLIGWFFLEGRLHPEDAADPQAVHNLDDADRKDSVRIFTVYWIAFLIMLLFILVLAAIDLLATARFGHRQRRQLEAEHRAILESETARLRQQRNGHE